MKCHKSREVRVEQRQSRDTFSHVTLLRVTLSHVTLSRVSSRKTNIAAFVLGDENGNEIDDDRESLLLFEGGTVCNNGWNDNVAHAVCRSMGRHDAVSWRNGNSRYIRGPA